MTSVPPPLLDWGMTLSSSQLEFHTCPGAKIFPAPHLPHPAHLPIFPILPSRRRAKPPTSSLPKAAFPSFSPPCSPSLGPQLWPPDWLLGSPTAVIFLHLMLLSLPSSCAPRSSQDETQMPPLSTQARNSGWQVSGKANAPKGSRGMMPCCVPPLSVSLITVNQFPKASVWNQRGKV